MCVCVGECVMALRESRKEKVESALHWQTSVRPCDFNYTLSLEGEDGVKRNQTYLSSGNYAVH